MTGDSYCQTNGHGYYQRTNGCCIARIDTRLYAYILGLMTELILGGLWEGSGDGKETPMVRTGW